LRTDLIIVVVLLAFVLVAKMVIDYWLSLIEKGVMP